MFAAKWEHSKTTQMTAKGLGEELDAPDVRDCLGSLYAIKIPSDVREKKGVGWKRAMMYQWLMTSCGYFEVVSCQAYGNNSLSATKMFPRSSQTSKKTRRTSCLKTRKTMVDHLQDPHNCLWSALRQWSSASSNPAAVTRFIFVHDTTGTVKSHAGNAGCILSAGVEIPQKPKTKRDERA